MKPNISTAPPNYHVLLVVFLICTALGTTSLVVAELFLPANSGGDSGRLAIYRYLGSATVCWLLISMWSWHMIQMAAMRRATEQKL